MNKEQKREKKSWKKRLKFDKKNKSIASSVSLSSSTSIEDVNILIEPTGNQPMSDHAQQHAALTRIQRDNVTNFAELDALEIKVTENTESIAKNKTDIVENKADIVENDAAIFSNSVDIAENSYKVALLDTRVEDVEEYLGAVDVEVSLGTGNYTYDNQIPPRPAHFGTLGNASFIEGEKEFWISNEDSRYNDLSQWDRARAGDKFSVFNSTQNKATYTIELISFDDIYDAWNIKAKFIEGTGELRYGTNYDLNIARVSRSFDPSNSVGDIQIKDLQGQVEAGEQVQSELLDRVAVGEAVQQQLEPTVAKNTQEINDMHNQVNQIRDEVNYFVRPIPWKYKSSAEPVDLKSGEFTVRTFRNESDGAGATIDFYLSEFDACGMRWYPQFAGTEYHHDLSGNFMITVGMLGSGVSLHAKSGKWIWNYGSNRCAKISGNYRKEKTSLMNNFLYIINFPGYLPMFATDQQITRVFTLEDEAPEIDVTPDDDRSDEVSPHANDPVVEQDG